ncbi:hypothetical protein C8Q79DRAFT_485763 [Trametes meyenii]|nr:hypothetical protein C8Q79DRAFT_485763 [Trametes meyenii]
MLAREEVTKRGTATVVRTIGEMNRSACRGPQHKMPQRSLFSGAELCTLFTSSSGSLLSKCGLRARRRPQWTASAQLTPRPLRHPLPRIPARVHPATLVACLARRPSISQELVMQPGPAPSEISSQSHRVRRFPTQTRPRTPQRRLLAVSFHPLSRAATRTCATHGPVRHTEHALRPSNARAVPGYVMYDRQLQDPACFLAVAKVLCPAPQRARSLNADEFKARGSRPDMAGLVAWLSASAQSHRARSEVSTL